MELNPKVAKAGLNMDSIPSDIQQGQLSFALNSCVEGFDGNQITYQNEQGNTLCITFPEGYKVIGKYNIIEQTKLVFFLYNPTTEDSEIGTAINNSCEYTTLINAKCLNFRLDKPIHKVVYKITNCNTEIYWTDAFNNRRYLDFDNLPYLEIPGDTQCDNEVTTEIDCNKLLVQANFDIPQLEITDVDSEGDLEAGDYQFAIQYSNGLSEAYTSYYSVTNPLPIFDPNKITQDFNYRVGKSIKVHITNIDDTGYYEYFNLAVIKTVNNISTPYLVGTYRIVGDTQDIIYTGQNKEAINLTIADIFEKFPYYEIADDLTTAQDVLIWSGLTTNQQVNYQKIWNKVKPQWQTNRLPGEKAYQNELHATYLRGYFRDEIYALEGCLLLDNGLQTDSFHIPGRVSNEYDREYIFNADVVQDLETPCDEPNSLQRWQVYNTGSVLGRLVNLCEPGVDGTIIGTVFSSCSDHGCTQQGQQTLVFTFEKPTPVPFQIKVGIRQYVDVDSNLVTGYDLFELEPEDEPNLQYSNPQMPFVIDIPQGVTTFTAVPIFHPGASNSRMVCHSCLFPLVDIYALPVSNDNLVRISISNGQGINIHNINPPVIPQEPTPDCTSPDCYEGPWEYGDFSYWESTDTYPCREDIWGELAGKPIRHHKFPDSLITHIHDNQGNIYPIGFRINTQEIVEAISESDLPEALKARIIGFKITRGNRANNKSVIARGLTNNVGKYEREETTYYFPNYPYNDLRPDPTISSSNTQNDSGSNPSIQLDAFSTIDSKERFTLHSPDTSFYQPFLGNILKLETVEFGKSRGHYLPVKDHSKYRFLSGTAFAAAFGLAIAIGGAPTGIQIVPFFISWVGPEGALQSYKILIDVIEKLAPYVNFAYQYNSVGNYDDFAPVPNSGNKQRFLDIATYAIPGVISTGDDFNLNNFQRESSVYLRTDTPVPLPYPNTIQGVPQDNSRWTLSEAGTCSTPRTVVEKDISSYYATIKRNIVNQYGQLYSYQTIDTGTQQLINKTSSSNPYISVFGGDCFINRFSYKSKFPYFIDNRVGNVNDSDIFYDEIGNVAYPTYWFSSDANYTSNEFKSLTQSLDLIGIGNVVAGVKRNNLDCRNDSLFYQNGKMYLFSYGVPTFWCESEVNTDLRQAYNSKEGDFYPHTSSDIPDEWLNTSIEFDNTYTYNKTYSKQNLENEFTHLPEDFTEEDCRHKFPFRAIFSEQQGDIANYRRNNWLIYRPAAKFDFPQNYGSLTSLDGIENKQVLARFENKTLLYNALLTAPTSAADVYLGQSLFSSQVPPLDYADTDLGYLGSQHKFLLKTEYGHFTVDAKRGQVFLLNGQKSDEISRVGLNKFFTEFLDFQINKYFPEYPIDNAFNGAGLHGVYDPKYNRILLTRLDYSPLSDDIIYEDGKFYITEETTKTIQPSPTCCPEGYIRIEDICTKEMLVPAEQVGDTSFIATPVSDVNYGADGSRIYSTFDNQGVGVFTQIPLTNTFWTNTGGTTDSPLNRVGFWNNTPDYSPTNVFVTVSIPLYVPTAKTYYLGISGDNLFGLSVDCEELFTSIGNFLDPNAPSFRNWSIYPITLSEGNHVITLKNMNTFAPSPLNPAAFGIELYSNTPSELINATSYDDLSVLFTSSSLFGETVEGFNYTCESGCNDVIKVGDDYFCAVLDEIPVNCITPDPIVIKTLNKTEVLLTDLNYFCNNSFTLSYSFDTQSWTSFHSYLPNYYIGGPLSFYSGINQSLSSSLWEHNTSLTLYNNFYGSIAPYILEYPFAYKYLDEIIQNVKDYSKVLQYTNFMEFVETNNYYFNKAVLYNNQQSSGLLKLTKKPVNNLKAYNEYPKYNADSKEILFTKSDNFYNFNTFWALNKDSQKPIWNKSCESLSIYKELNQDNHNYSKRSFRKAPLRAKDLRIRLINDDKDEYKFLSNFVIGATVNSYK